VISRFAKRARRPRRQELDRLSEVHGGDLGGFILIRGERDRLAKVRASAEFERLTVRAGFIVENVGVVSALLDGEAARFVGQAATLTADLA
jgi:hypothetical protein